MSKQRFRDVKKGKIAPSDIQVKPKYLYAKSPQKIKAFLTDSFMLMMPILYVVIYLVMGGREGFALEKALGWMYIFIPLVIIQTLFMSKTSQTPGYRAYNLEIIDEKTGKKPRIFIILFRNFCAVLSFFSIIGWVIMFFNKNSKTLHDFLSNTAVVNKS